jgi:xylulokinase
MSATPTLLGIDLGTSSVKVVLTDPAGHLLDQATEAYPVERPRPGWAETDPQAWWDAIVKAVARLTTANARQVAGIGLSGQMHGVVLCTADSTPTRPALLWCDARAEPQLDLYRQLPAQTRARLGNPLSAGMAGPQLAWLHRQEPATVDRARWALQPKDWIRARLTGQFAAEPSDASATLLYDILSQDWDDTVIDALGLRRSLLPDILAHSGVCAGRLTTTAAAGLGLTTDVPVAAGAADTAAAALGTGLLAPGRTQLTIGTGVQIVSIVDTPAPSTADPVAHLYRDATPTGWYAMAASLTGGQTLDWVRSILGSSWAELYQTAAREPRADDPVFVPHLVGERTPYLDTQLRGSWTGLAASHTRTDLLYAALEGVAFAAADALHALPGTIDTDNGLLIAGGGTTSPPWRALLSDVLGLPLDAVAVPSASARGAGLLGATAAGLTTLDDLAATSRLASERVAEPGPRANLLRQRHDQYRRVLIQLGNLN